MYNIDNLKRQKFHCNMCNKNHYTDTAIGKEHFGKQKGGMIKKERNKSESLLRTLHDKANMLMKKQRILNQEIDRKSIALGKHNLGTKVHSNKMKTISNIQDKNRKLTAEITETLRKKDKLLNQKKSIPDYDKIEAKMKMWRRGYGYSLKETGYIDYHKSLAEKGLESLKEHGYKIHEKVMKSDGWGDSMKTIHVKVSKDGEMKNLKWHDANKSGQWMEKYEAGGAGSFRYK